MTLDEARRPTMTMVSTDDAATAATPEFVPLSKHIGCEVRGIDLRKPLRPDTISDEAFPPVRSRRANRSW